MEKTIILKKKGNLKKYKSTGIHLIDKKEYEKAQTPSELEGEFYQDISDDQPLMGTVKNLTPHYNSHRNEWSFEGEFQDLKRIAEGLRLTDEEGQIITVDETSLKNRYDKFFNHKTLWTSTFMEEGSIALSDSDFLQEFYMRTYLGREDIPRTGKKMSTFMTAGSGFEIIVPTEIQNKKSKKIDKEMEAVMLLKEMTYDKQKRVAAVINPVGFKMNHNDPDALRTLLYNSCVQNDEQMHNKWGKTYQDVFLEIGSLPNDRLEIYWKVFQLKNHNIIKVSGTHGATFRGEPIGNGKITTDRMLINYYLDPENYEDFKKVEQELNTL